MISRHHSLSFRSGNSFRRAKNFRGAAAIVILRFCYAIDLEAVKYGMGRNQHLTYPPFDSRSGFYSAMGVVAQLDSFPASSSSSDDIWQQFGERFWVKVLCLIVSSMWTHFAHHYASICMMGFYLAPDFHPVLNYGWMICITLECPSDLKRQEREDWASLDISTRNQPLSKKLSWHHRCKSNCEGTLHTRGNECRSSSNSKAHQRVFTSSTTYTSHALHACRKSTKKVDWGPC